MKRTNQIVLSDTEKELLLETKRAMYGDEAIPHGHVIGTALSRMLHSFRDREVALAD